MVIAASLTLSVSNQGDGRTAALGQKLTSSVDLSDIHCAGAQGSALRGGTIREKNSAKSMLRKDLALPRGIREFRKISDLPKKWDSKLHVASYCLLLILSYRSDGHLRDERLDVTHAITGCQTAIRASGSGARMKSALRK